MSVEGDKRNYTEAMITQAFRKLYTKETNHHSHVNHAHGVGLTANATCDDNNRYINITVRIAKVEGE